MTVTVLLPDLPIELFSDIVEHALQTNSHPCDILTVNSTFYALGIPALYRRLSFRNAQQLKLFSQVTSSVPFPPRHIELSLPGGSVDFLLFQALGSAFVRCSNDKTPGGLALESLSLCLNSHQSNPYLYHIYQTFKQIK